MHVLITCKNEEDPTNNKGARVLTRFSKSMGILSDTQGQLTPQSLVQNWLKFKIVRDIMVVLFTCKNKEDPIKFEGARVFTTLYIHFSDTQGQITLDSVVSSRNWNSSKLSCMSLLP